MDLTPLQHSPALLALATGLLGLCVGSFLNVVIHRLPIMMNAEWRADCAEFEGREAPPKLPRAEAKDELAKYTAAREIIWCQEEPMNQGAWYQIKHHLQAVASNKQTIAYAGRARSPAPACGHLARHLSEQAALVEQALVSPISSDYALE